MKTYHHPDGATAYNRYLASPEGVSQQQILNSVFLQELSQSKPLRTLDAGCGTGWLTNTLHSAGYTTHACDASATLLEVAQKNYPHIHFLHADIQKKLPFQTAYFDCIVLNMVIADVQHPGVAFKNLADLLTAQGSMLITLPNPYLTQPVGMWKRGFKKLINGKPELKLIPKNYWGQIHQTHAWSSGLGTYFRPLADYIADARQAGLYVNRLTDIQSPHDSTSFDLYYKLHRFPILLLVEFKKLS